ncbi:MAG: Na(+)-translocating NADH-quinone reductase subunit C [Deltaproteobacteria bacterium]|nr:Na(+)-translocating NADH-quinone reductase subunit C [Deltaproteobacteria bacterium]MBT8480056.1 Na(+)-translocating NADH-quinone reductase subunit C [Deltaproteobacteria bacterium]NNK05995.1 Na(+)-translocating NADH-quinone reductase subunit C [Myxococcales bacterium]NNL22923.1 Na(+)-translocating NADH-quinone reductase subunit C [Myxococcales bacterium]
MPEASPQATARTETVTRTLLVALFVSLVCSSFVASAAIVLKPRQVENAIEEMRRNILQVAGLWAPDADLDELFESIEPRVVELETGAYVEGIDPEAYDPVEASKDPARSIEIPSELDVAKVGRRAKHALVYLVLRDGELSKIILPISGYGLWSTLHGFLALEADANTVADITFYEHGETPGLGDFIVKPAWRELWRGKRAFDDSGSLALSVVKGRVADDDPLADYRVDGVSGATLTGNGVTNIIQYWLGEHGYGPFLAKLQAGAGS